MVPGDVSPYSRAAHVPNVDLVVRDKDVAADEDMEATVTGTTDGINRSRGAGTRRAAAWAAGAVLLLGALALAQDAAPPDLPKGIGPITEVTLGEIDPAMAAAGEATFDMLCSACHKFGERYVGPDMSGVTARRAPEWIMNMILNTNQMIFEDDTAYELLAEYMTPMPQLLLTEDQAREVLEYFRLKDAEAAGD